MSIHHITAFLSCLDKKQNKAIVSNHPDYSFKNEKEDTLFIKYSFPDCGEWGGHEELIKSYRSEKSIKLNYMKFDVDCGVRTSFGLLVQNKKLEKNIVLSDSQQSELMKYINDIIKLQFMEKKISHSGIAFSLTNTTGSLTILILGTSRYF